MKKFIRYLYEYQNGKRVQNVGFVKVEQNEDYEVIQIYGKGFPTGGNQEVEVFAFYMMGQFPVGISMGAMKGTKPMFGYRLEFSAEDVGGKEIFGDMDGVILLDDRNGFKRWYAAVWDERPVPVEQMQRREDVLRRDSEISREEEDVPETIVEESVQEEESAESESAEAEPVGMPPEEAVPVEEESVKEEPAEEMQESPEESAAPVGNGKIYKITREDLSGLPRKEWRLANNNFLLHGYYNYHHLVSFQKDEDCWLGVPGIYHPKEQKAADAFGFGQFMKPDEGEIELAADETSEGEDFGYWCRKVGTVIEK